MTDKPLAHAVLKKAVLDWAGEHTDCDDLCTHKALERADAEQFVRAIRTALGDAGYWIATDGAQ